MVRGIRVSHLMTIKRAQLHSLVPFARVRGLQITYPPSERGDRKHRLEKRSAELFKNSVILF